MVSDPDRLKKVGLFDGVTDEERAELASWLDEEGFAEGMSITHEGQSDYAFFILDEGTVNVMHDGSQIGTLGPGDVFGELALLGDGHRKADAVAATEAVVLSMFGTHFREMQRSMPTIAKRLEELAASRQRELG